LFTKLLSALDATGDIRREIFVKYDKTRMLVTALAIILASALMPECAVLLASPPFSSTEAPADPAVAIDEYAPLTSSSSSTAVSVDPAVVIDDYALRPTGSNLSVDVRVSDVNNLYAWQVNMSWNPSVLNLSGVVPGSFFPSGGEWQGRPFLESVTPLTDATKNPASTNPSFGNWTTPAWAYTSNNQYSTCNVEGREQTYLNYNIPALSFVTKVEVGIESWTLETIWSEQDKIELQVSGDGGATWGQVHVNQVYRTESLLWQDVTSDFSWTSSMLTNANFRVKIKYKQIGATAATISLDWIPVRITGDTLNVENPVRVRDQNLNSYASFCYGQASGNFTVSDFGHNFPNGGMSMVEESSRVVQVDFYMKFAANASALGDRYRIFYTAPLTNDTVYILKDWTSTATVDGTYSWLNQIDPNFFIDYPSTWGWDWDSVSAVQLTVETEKVFGGDPGAKFYEYEAWIVVKYERPVWAASYLEREAGWILYGQMTDGNYPDVSGSGVLCSFNFTVVGYGCSALKITGTGTKLLKRRSFLIPLPIRISGGTEDGYFRNGLTGDANLDKSVNVFDILAVKSRWGRTPDSPDWIREYDVNDDQAINVFDILTVKANWGQSW